MRIYKCDKFRIVLKSGEDLPIFKGRLIESKIISINEDNSVIYEIEVLTRLYRNEFDQYLKE